MALPTPLINVMSMAARKTARPLVRDGMEVTAELIDGVGVKLPQHVVVEMKEADPVVKGQTASSSYKPAIIDNGMRVMVPPRIEAGTRIVVSTEDASYVERAKD